MTFDSQVWTKANAANVVERADRDFKNWRAIRTIPEAMPHLFQSSFLHQSRRSRSKRARCADAPGDKLRDLASIIFLEWPRRRAVAIAHGLALVSVLEFPRSDRGSIVLQDSQ